MQSQATSVDAYLKELPEDRRESLEAVRKVFHANLDPAIEEGMQYGMIGYYIPHSIYPQGYHCDPKQPLPYAGLASQKGHMSLYLMGLYANSELLQWFQAEWMKTGKKLDMGKACIRFKKLEDLPLELIGQAIKRCTKESYVARYEAMLPEGKGGKSPGKKSSTNKPSPKEQTVKKQSSKKQAAKNPSAKKQSAKKQSTKKQPVKKQPVKKKSVKKKSAKKK